MNKIIKTETQSKVKQKNQNRNPNAFRGNSAGFNSPDILFETYQKLLISVLSLQDCPWPSGAPGDFQQYFLRRTRSDGIQLICFELASKQLGWNQWPESIRGQLQQCAQHDAIIDTLRQQDLINLLLSLRKLGAEPILLKGGALALTHYAESYLRTRNDTDLLLPAADRKKIRDGLHLEGYESILIEGKNINQQQVFVRPQNGNRSAFDLHYNILNPVIFRNALTYDEIVKEAVTVKLLTGESILAIGESHALLHACMHRVAHHEAEKLIWLYDIALLLADKSADWLENFRLLAQRKRMSAICADAFRSLSMWIPLDILSDEVISKFKMLSAEEPSAQLLNRNPSLFGLMLEDMTAESNLSSRVTILIQHLFPSAEYMKKKYGVRKRGLLFFYYLKRIFGGAGKIFAPLNR